MEDGLILGPGDGKRLRGQDPVRFGTLLSLSSSFIRAMCGLKDGYSASELAGWTFAIYHGLCFFFLFYSLTQRTNVFCRASKGTCGRMSNGRRLMKDREGLYEILNEHVNILAKGRGQLQQDPA